MSWATRYISDLQQQRTVEFRPRGNSMKPLIKSGDLVKVEPVDNRKLKVGDIVLCKVNGRHYLHLIKATRKGQFQIGNNKGYINGWIHKNAVYGIAMEITR